MLDVFIIVAPFCCVVQALDAIQTAIALDRGCVRAHELRGDIASATGDTGNAISALFEAWRCVRQDAALRIEAQARM